MTHCLRSLAPTDEELLRYVLDGEPLSAAAREHLEQCHFCQQRLTEYASTHDLMLSLSCLYRFQCPNATILSHYCIGILSMDEAMRVAGHLDICPLCTNEVAETRLLLATFEPFPEEQKFAPATHEPRLVAHSLSQSTQSTTWNNNADAREQSWPRQYQADTVSISLHLARDKEGALLLLGLLSSMYVKESAHIELLADTKVELYRVHSSALSSIGDDTLALHAAGMRGPHLSTRVDELGHIVFKSVPSGRYLMIIYLPEAEVVIEELDIRPY